MGAQDCHHAEGGAFTGDISAAMIADAGAKFVILGHSERRTGHSEGDAMVRAKAESALAAGLRIIMCCGESAETRESGKAVAFVNKQLKASLPLPAAMPADVAERLTVAYEPIWAVGSGTPATPADIGEMHAAIRALLIELFGAEQGAEVRILYGGSVKPENAGEIFAVPEVGGALIGGASLTADSFMGIAGCQRAVRKLTHPRLWHGAARQACRGRLAGLHGGDEISLGVRDRALHPKHELIACPCLSSLP